MAAEGFKVADAYIAVHTEDDTRRGREQIRRDTDRWARDTGDKAGDSMGNRMLAKLGKALQGLFSALMKFTVVSAVVTILGGAVAGLGGYIVQLMAGVNTLAVAVTQAVGALLLLPGAIVTVVGTLLTVKLAFSGIGAALKAGIQQAGGAVQDQVDKIIKAFDKLTGAVLGWRSAERGVEASFDSLHDALVQSAGSFDITNAKGRAASNALDDIIKAAQQAAQAKYNETGSIEQANAVYDQYIQRLRDTLSAAGVADAQINQLLDTVGRFPTTFDSAAGGANAFNDALKKLSPNAQAFVRELLRLKSAFDQVKFTLQDRMFAGLADQLREVAVTLLPVLNTGFGRLGGALNAVARQFISFLGSTKGQNNLLSIFENLATTIDNVASALRPLLEALSTVIDVSTGAIADLTEGLGDLAAGWADSIEQMAESGRLREIIDSSLVALKQIGGALVDIWGIVTGIFKAAGQGDFFGVLDRLNKLINTPEVQANLKSIFDALKVAANALTPVLGGILKQLGVILPVLSDAMVAISPFLVQLVDVLGPGLIIVLRILQGFLTGLAPSIVDLIATLGPALRPLIAVAPEVGQALGALVSAVAPILKVAGPALAKVLVVLADALTQIANSVGPQLPVIFQSITDLIVGLLPIVPPLVEALLPLFGPEMVKAITDIAPLIPDLARSFTDLVIAILPIVPPLTQLFIWITRLLVIVQLKPLIEGLTWLFKGLVWVIDWLVSSLKEAYHWFDDNGPIERWFKSIGKFFSGLWEKVQEFWDWIIGLPGKILEKMKDFGTLLVNKGKDLIQGLIDGIKSKAKDLVDTIKNSVTDLIPDWIKKKLDMHSPSKLMEGLGEDTMDGYIGGVKNRKRTLADVLDDVFGKGGPGPFPPPPGSSGAMGGGGGGRGDIYLMVQIGDKPVTDMVVAAVGANPEAVAKAADEGNRRNAFLNPGRKRVGDR